MSLDEQARQALDRAMDGVGRELEELLGTVITDVRQRATTSQLAALEEARRAWEAEVSQRVDAVVNQARAAWEQAHADAVGEATRQGQAEAERVRVEADDAIRAAQDVADRRVAEAIEAATTRVRDEMVAELRLAQYQAVDVMASLTSAEDAARAAERQAAHERFTRLLAAIVRLDRCTNLKDALDVLSQCLSSEAPGAMVLVVRGHELRRWPGDATLAPDEGIVPLEEAGDLATLVRTASMQELKDLGRFSSSAGWPREEAGGVAALGVPVTLGSRAVAIICAPAGGPEARGTAWADGVQIMARHASRVLEALTAFRTAGIQPAPPPAQGNGAVAGCDQPATATTPSEERPSEATDATRAAAARYAHLLVAEIKLYCEPQVTAGREHKDLRERMHPEIDRARRLFEERVPAALTWRDALFEEELVRTLADGDASLLGDRTAEPV